MNERIQALVEQADRWARIMTWSDDPRYGDKPVSDLFNQKFAELIVRDCAGIAYEYDIPNLTGPGEFIGNRMKKHFGVEP
jgi:hypothetical protein